jgi:translocation protein SEC66
MAANTVFRNRLDEVQAKTESEKQWWEKRRASIQSEFMKELDTPTDSTPAKTPTSKSGSDEETIMVESPTVSGTGSVRKKKGKN